MWASLLAGLLAWPWAQRVVGFAIAALAVLLLILNLRRQGERAGRAAEHMDQLERTHAIQRQMLDAAANRLAAALILLSGCAGVGFDGPPSACPPVVEYSQVEQSLVADEVAALPEGAKMVD